MNKLDIMAMGFQYLLNSHCIGVNISQMIESIMMTKTWMNLKREGTFVPLCTLVEVL